MASYDRITAEGARDVLFEDCRALRAVERRLRELYRAAGYHEVMTPSMEFFDVYASGVGALPQHRLYALTGDSGRLLSLRADSTKPIARLYAARKDSLRLPLRLFYNQPVFRRADSYSGRSAEIPQVGAELLGAGGGLADAEALWLASRSLSELFGENYRIEIGHAAMYAKLLGEADVPESVRGELTAAVIAKNSPEVRRLLGEGAERFIALIELYGDCNDVRSRAEKLFGNGAYRETLEYLRRLTDILGGMGLADKLLLDLGSEGAYGYYTGIVFKGYAGGAEVLSGGRYDTLYGDYGLSVPAAGFAINCEAACAALPPRAEGGGRQLCVLHCGAGREADAFGLLGSAAEGKRIQLSLCKSLEESIDYARAEGAKRVINLTEDGKAEEIEL